MTATAALAVAIPACDEEALLGRCLDALARQRDAGDFTVVVLANNCTDATVAVARAPRSIAIRTIDHAFAADQRGAGHARRLAMAIAAEDADIVLTTDADCVPDPTWIASHRAAFACGVDAVAGRVSADMDELRRQPADAVRIGALEWEYLTLMATAEAVFDPRPHDPLPRHAQRCGANIGITRAMLDRVGGVPAMATGEDRALLDAVEHAGGRIRFDPVPCVTASARIVGRATGGMADALRARMAPDYRCDDQFAPADTLVGLWRARHAARGSGYPAMAGPPARDEDRLHPADLPVQIARMRALLSRHG